LEQAWAAPVLAAPVWAAAVLALLESAARASASVTELAW
jgi:hypothetical protein